MPEISLVQRRHLQQFFVQSIRDHPQNPIVIAEGDSWWAYPIYANVIDHLDEMVQHRMSLLRLESSGDELIGMLDDGGVGFLRKLMNHHHPDVLLLSGGGNDIVGPELLTFIAKRTAPFDTANALATDALDERFAAMRSAYDRLIAARDAVAPRCTIVTHGYARAIPTGKKATFIGVSSGPWIKPFLIAQGYTDFSEQQAIVDALLGRFNTMLDALSGPKFIKVNFRDAITADDWSNELHPTRHGFQSCAGVLLQRLNELMPEKFPVT